MEGAYELFQRGTALLAQGDFHAAVVPLSRARDLEPGKDSIREALGRALFGARRYDDAREEFEAVVEHAPTNDYALFCLGRSLQQLGRHAEARHPLALAANLRPERHDYRLYRERSRKAGRPKNRFRPAPCRWPRTCGSSGATGATSSATPSRSHT